MPWLVVALLAGAGLLGAGAPDPWPDLSRPPPFVGGGEADAALIVAIEEYEQLPHVAGARANGLAWHAWLSDTLGVPEVTLLAASTPKPTAAAIRQAARATAAAVRPGGRVWLIFIGHGTPAREADGSGRRQGLLVAINARNDATEEDFYQNTVSRDELRDLLVDGQPAGRAHAPVVMLVDACFSGVDSAGGAIRPGGQLSNYGALVPLADVAYLAAGQPTEVAGPLPGARRPAFSYLVLGALQGWAARDDEAPITAREATLYARNVLTKVTAGSASHQPQFDGTDLPLARPAGRPAPDPYAIRERLEAVRPAPTPGSDGALRSQLEDLQKAQVERERAEAEAARAREAERQQREKALAEHASHVERDWADVQRLAKRGGPEARQAVQIFLAAYGDHALGNPREAEARDLQRRLEGPAGFVRIEPGSFWMGSPDGKACPAGYPGACEAEAGRDDDEPLHRVTLTRAFWLQATEVTQGEWQALMGNNPSHFKSCGADCPVERVNWYEAVAYANARSRAEGLEECYDVGGPRGTPGGGCKEGETGCVGDFSYQKKVSLRGLDCAGYRLPTEAEWEYAARAGTITAFWTGACLAATQANYDGNHPLEGCTKGRYQRTTVAVRSFEANPWGLYDVHGNVWEWCHDAYAKFDGAATDPVVEAGGVRVLRGGSWNGVARRVRSADRDWSGPAWRLALYGFRLSRSIR